MQARLAMKARKSKALGFLRKGLAFEPARLASVGNKGTRLSLTLISVADGRHSLPFRHVSQDAVALSTWPEHERQSTCP